MLDPARSIESVVTLTKPYLLARSVGGTLMLGAHLIFAYHYWRMVRGGGPERPLPAWSEGRVAG